MTMKELFKNARKSLDILYDNVRSSDVEMSEAYLLSALLLIDQAEIEYYRKYKKEQEGDS